jgi:CMP-N-acetylneuraminic acid synthetase
MTRDCLENQKSILGKKAGAVIIDTPLVNIDTIDDFEHLEKLLAPKNSIQ